MKKALPLDDAEKLAQQELLAACVRKLDRYLSGVGPAAGTWPILARAAGLDMGEDGELVVTTPYARTLLSRAWTGGFRLPEDVQEKLRAFLSESA